MIKGKFIMQTECQYCKSKKLFIEIQANGNRRGLYCGECGKWQKWLTRQELQVYKYNNFKIV